MQAGRLFNRNCVSACGSYGGRRRKRSNHIISVKAHIERVARKNLLWDFDGTLFDTYPAYARILKKVVGDVATEKEIWSHLKISFSHAVEHYRLSEKQIKEVLDQEQKLHPADTPPFPNVEQVLNRANVNVVKTHKYRKEVMNILNYYGWDKYFKEIVAGDDGFPRKPDPESYHYLHQKYILDWAIGDREIDMVPAKAIGIKTCLFRNETPGADLYVTDYGDFLKAVFGGIP